MSGRNRLYDGISEISMVVVSVAVADWVLSPCEVTVMVAVSVVSVGASGGIATMISTTSLAPAASGPTRTSTALGPGISGTAVGQALPLTVMVKVSVV